MGIIVVAVVAVVILFLPSKKPTEKESQVPQSAPAPEPPAPKVDEKKEGVKDDIIASLDKEIAQLKEDLQKEQLKNSSLQGELNAAKKAEMDLTQEVEELKKNVPGAPTESEAVAMELLKNENETLKSKLLAQTKELAQLKEKEASTPQTEETTPQPEPPKEEKPAESEKQPEPPAEEPKEAVPEEKPEAKPEPPKEEPDEKKPEPDSA